MSDIFVSNFLNYKEHIEPYRLIKIFAGVGSGKNSFIEDFIIGDKQPEIPKKTVLFITSRRAKVDETISSIDIADNTALSKWAKKQNPPKLISKTNYKYDNNSEYKVIPSVDEETKKVVKQESVVCTNAFIEYYFREIYNPTDSSTFLWELFDMIVVDEVHSLALDATYQSAPFYVNELIMKTLSLCKNADENPNLRRPNCKHIILMTGTPNPIKEHITNITNSELEVEYDLFKKCRNIVPEYINLINKNEVKTIIKYLLDKKKKFIYFSNRTMTSEEFMKLYKLEELPKIAVSFSDKDKRRNLSPIEKDLMEKVENSLRNESKLPDNVDIFVTTSRNKEGINIENPDIKHMFIEAHNPNDIIQMAGRVRKGLKHLYIVMDAEQHLDTENHFEQPFEFNGIAYFENGIIQGSANRYYKTLCENNNLQSIYNNNQIAVRNYPDTDINDYINFIHNKFPYIKYSYLENTFYYYSVREIGKKEYNKSNASFDSAKTKGKKHLELMCAKWYDFATKKPTVFVANNNAQRALLFLEKRIAEKSGEYFTTEEKDLLLTELNDILGGKPLKNFNSLLKRFSNYKIKQLDTHIGNENYDKWFFVKE